MKSLVVTDSVTRAAGGLFDAERRLHQELLAVGVDVALFSLADEFVSADVPAWLPIVPRTFPIRPPAVLGRSPEQHRALMAEQGDILYRAGLWRWPSRSAHGWTRKHRKPEVIAPHGMLDPWAVRNSAWKKQIVRWLFENSHLREAACLRALCRSEADAIRAFGLKNPVAIIPNGIDVPEPVADSVDYPSSILHQLKRGGRRVLLYLGRLHPKKGLANLLRAWKSVVSGQSSSGPASEWTLAIAGWDQNGHEAELKQLATELGIEWADARESIPSSPRWGRGQGEVSSHSSVINPPSSLLFLGPQFGVDKAACYANCDAFILPSYSEGLPMVVLEAWAYGKPVLMTPECNLPEGFAANAALRIEPNPESIEAGLTELFRAPPAALRTLGTNGRSLVSTKFAWPKIAERMLAVYRWLIEGGSPPDSVQLK